MSKTPQAITSERRASWVRKLWEKTNGAGWEPPDPSNAIIDDLVAAGFLRRTDGICGFERMREACVTWTEAGRLAAQSLQQPAPPIDTEHLSRIAQAMDAAFAKQGKNEGYYNAERGLHEVRLDGWFDLLEAAAAVEAALGAETGEAAR